MDYIWPISVFQPFNILVGQPMRVDSGILDWDYWIGSQKNTSLGFLGAMNGEGRCIYGARQENRAEIENKQVLKAL